MEHNQGCSTLFIFVCLFCFALSALAEPKLTASLDRDTITLGEGATLTLSFEGARPNEVPTIAAPRNVTIQYIGQNTSVTIVAGKLGMAAVDPTASNGDGGLATDALLNALANAPVRCKDIANSCLEDALRWHKEKTAECGR